MSSARRRSLASWVQARLDRWWDSKEAPLPAVELQDPTLSVFDDGVAELFRDGQLHGHLFTRREAFWSPGFGKSTRWSVYLRIVWLDGTRSSLEEDYGMRWALVPEIECGRLEHQGLVYGVRWLPCSAAQALRAEVGDVLHHP
ncbi:hypothetical protein ACQB6R_03770 [Propionibacteriaceae bacterium G1746]|uniref:hypothetical protein n=1 Tax=Aestuariimicrobium sp. G57 TaxID=3418485 RepID=UPI003C13492D